MNRRNFIEITFKGQNALVTGAASGMGLATCGSWRICCLGRVFLRWRF